MSETKPAPKPRKPRATKPASPAPEPAATKPDPKPAPETKPEPAPSLISGKPWTLRRAMGLAAHLDPFATPETMKHRGRGGGSGTLADTGLVTYGKLLPGPETKSFLIRALLTGGAPSAVAALDRATEWADATISDPVALAASNMPPEWHLDRVASIVTRRGRPVDPRVNRVCAVAYVMSAPGRFPDWVLDAPIPDALREPGLAAIVERAEALAGAVAGADGATEAPKP